MGTSIVRNNHEMHPCGPAQKDPTAQQTSGDLHNPQSSPHLP